MKKIVAIFAISLLTVGYTVNAQETQKSETKKEKKKDGKKCKKDSKCCKKSSESCTKGKDSVN